jgi:two-component system cell cycle response regulator DivK
MSTERIIAIFDDDEDILTICSYILTELGWQVHTFTSCAHILDQLGGLRPAVIFMDNWIPDEGGIVATRTLKESARFRYTPVVYFSANSDIGLLAEAAGADAYLAKPFDLDELEKMITRVRRAVDEPR